MDGHLAEIDFQVEKRFQPDIDPLHRDLQLAVDLPGGKGQIGQGNGHPLAGQGDDRAAAMVYRASVSKLDPNRL